MRFKSLRYGTQVADKVQPYEDKPPNIGLQPSAAGVMMCRCG
jgi:hypothetical protein